MKALDPLLHNQLRLAVMALLAQNEVQSFNILLEHTGASRGNLSVQISALEQVGYLEVIKSFMDKKPLTQCQITEKGKAAMFEYTEALKGYLNL